MTSEKTRNHRIIVLPSSVYTENTDNTYYTDNKDNPDDTEKTENTENTDNKIACFKVKLNWTRGSFFDFAP